MSKHLEYIGGVRTVRDLLVLACAARGPTDAEDVRNEVEMALAEPFSEDAVRTVIRRLVKAKLLAKVSTGDASISELDGSMPKCSFYRASARGLAVMAHFRKALQEDAV